MAIDKLPHQFNIIFKLQVTSVRPRYTNTAPEKNKCINIFLVKWTCKLKVNMHSLTN